MQQEKLVEMIRAATHEVFGTMLGIELTDGEASVAQSAPEPIDGVVAIVGLAGR